MFLLSHDLIESKELRESMHNSLCGAFVSFEGWIRDKNEDKPVIELMYEAYAPLALNAGTGLVQDIIRDFNVHDLRCVHRLGCLMPGEMAVWIGVTAVHRSEAFQACEAFLDRMKQEIPIWKHEFYRGNESVWLHPVTEEAQV